MNKERYKKIIRFFENNKTAKTILSVVYKIFPLTIFVTYPLLLVLALFTGLKDFLITLILPATIFGFVTILRIAINEQRPYEKYGINPVFKKDTVGKSMPSRHTASAFIISLVALRLDIAVGILLLCISTLITTSRVLCGVHYIKDVVVGALISICSFMIAEIFF